MTFRSGLQLAALTLAASASTVAVAVVALPMAVALGLWAEVVLAGAHRVPLFSAASGPWQGFVRVINHDSDAGVVRIHAIDDDGRWFGPVELAIGAGDAKHFNSDDLENGNAKKGMSGVGRSTGDWRLEMESTLDIEVLAYVRTRDGFLTAMHDISPFDGERHWVPTFNPGSNVTQVSRLRITNTGGEEVAVSIVGIDDLGAVGEAKTTVSAGASRTLSAQELEQLGLGDGVGKWRLAVESDEPLIVMHLLVSPTGHLTNLSTAPKLLRMERPSRMLVADGSTVTLRSTAALSFGSSARPTCTWTQNDGPAVELYAVDSERVRFTVPAVSDDGATLSFRADCANGGIRISDIVPIDVVPKRTERTLSALVDFLDVDAADRPFTLRDLKNLLTDGPDSLERYLEATSRNLVDVEFDILNWVTVDKRRTTYPLGGGSVVQDVVAKLSEVADLGAYDKVFPAIYPLEQGYPGCAAYQEPLTWNTPNGEFRLGAAWLSGYDMGCVRKGRQAHEYAHTFGFGHSYLLDCEGRSRFDMPASTTHPMGENDACNGFDQYNGGWGVVVNADPDMLGGDLEEYYEDYFPMHLQAVWQAQAGWLAETQVSVANTTRSSWITSLETLTPTPKAVKVPLGLDHYGDAQSYWLETRHRFPPVVYDAETNTSENVPCSVHVRLQANTIEPYDHYEDRFVKFAGEHTFRFHSFVGTLGDTVAHAGNQFWDPYRGVAVEILDCIEDDAEVAVNVSIRRTRLEVSPPIVVSLDRGTATVSLRNGGDSSVSIGRASVGGRNAPSFSITTDTCSGASLANGETCEITVRGETDETAALLRIPNDDDLIPEAVVTLFRG